jgi:hypothetical protein
MEALLAAAGCLKPKPVGVVRAQDAIVRYLKAHGLASEASLRAHCGNTPDVSKGLRGLVREGVVGRFGLGGKLRAYRYFVN